MQDLDGPRARQASCGRLNHLQSEVAMHRRRSYRERRHASSDSVLHWQPAKLAGRRTGDQHTEGDRARSVQQ